MNKKQRFVRIGLLVAIVVILDQVSKYIAVYLLEGRGVVSLFGDCLRFLFAENRGGFLSMGASLSEGMRTVVFVAATSIFLLLFFLYTLFDKHVNGAALFASSMIIGGGIGNLIDRTVRDGAVIDFVNVGVGGLRTGIFNVADMAVLFGCIVMFFSLRKGGGRAPQG